MLLVGGLSKWICKYAVRPPCVFRRNVAWRVPWKRTSIWPCSSWYYGMRSAKWHAIESIFLNVSFCWIVREKKITQNFIKIGRRNKSDVAILLARLVVAIVDVHCIFLPVAWKCYCIRSNSVRSMFTQLYENRMINLPFFTPG